MPLLSRLKKHSTGIFTLAACALMAGGLATSPAFAVGGTPADNNVTICHATGSATNPYVVITPAKAGVVNGHYDEHQSAADIIPPFEWQGQTFSGQNWDANGMAIHRNGCVAAPAPTSPPPTTTKPPTTPPDDTEVKKIAFCHATGSATNPYVFIETSVAAFFVAGHVDHAGDIWPPFTYVKQGVTINQPGQNWDAEGQAIFNAGCVKTVVTTPPATTQPPTTQPPGTQPPASKPPVAQPQPSGAAKGVPFGAARPAPAQSVSIAADTAAQTGGADHTVSGALFGAGALLMAWVLLTRHSRRPRGQHA